MGFFGLFKKKKEEAVSLDKNINTAEKVQEPTKEPLKPAEEKSESFKTPVAKAAQNLSKPKNDSAEDKAAVKKTNAKPEKNNTTVKKASSFAGKFEIKKSKDGKYVFNLYAANSVIVATSQIYSSSAAAQNGIKSVMENAERANIEDQTLKSYEPQNFPKWEIYLDKGNQFRFRLSASNGSCICHSQGYTTKASCKNGIESIIKTAKVAAVDKAYIKKD